VHIFSYFFVFQHDGSLGNKGQLIIRDSRLLRPDREYYFRPVHLVILETCRQLRIEGRHYLCRNNDFEVEVKLYRFYDDYIRPRTSPSFSLYKYHLSDLRVNCRMDISSAFLGICTSFARHVLGQLSSLKRLQVAITPENWMMRWTRRELVEQSRESYPNNGIVENVVENARCSVALE
jgi:hypothetical protein